jgi:hypothetical protein
MRRGQRKSMGETWISGWMATRVRAMCVSDEPLSYPHTCNGLPMVFHKQINAFLVSNPLVFCIPEASIPLAHDVLDPLPE